jgi:endonuclease I
MNTNKTLTLGVVLAAGLSFAAATSAAARITPAQAEAAAVKKIPGTAKSAKYEFEDGRWQYAVIVMDHAKQMYEVEVNAATGRVTDTEKTSPGEEASEAAADKKAAAKKAAH